MRKIKETKKKATKKPVVEEETINLKNVIKVFIVILIFFIIFYGLTILVVNKRNSKKDEDKKYNGIEVKSNDIMVSDILSKSDDKYYVIAIKGDKENYELYLNSIQEPLYNINLDNALNKGILGSETIITEDPRDIRINDTTLFVVENHVITEYYVGKDDVVNKLKTIAF